MFNLGAGPVKGFALDPADRRHHLRLHRRPDHPGADRLVVPRLKRPKRPCRSHDGHSDVNHMWPLIKLHSDHDTKFPLRAAWRGCSRRCRSSAVIATVVGFFYPGPQSRHRLQGRLDRSNSTPARGRWTLERCAALSPDLHLGDVQVQTFGRPNRRGGPLSDALRRTVPDAVVGQVKGGDRPARWDRSPSLAHRRGRPGGFRRAKDQAGVLRPAGGHRFDAALHLVPVRAAVRPGRGRRPVP